MASQSSAPDARAARRAAFERLPPPRQQYFIKDGIHFTEAGDAAMADLLQGCIQRADATRGFER